MGFGAWNLNKQNNDKKGAEGAIDRGTSIQQITLPKTQSFSPSSTPVRKSMAASSLCMHLQLPGEAPGLPLLFHFLSLVHIPYMASGDTGMSHLLSTGSQEPLISPSLRRPVSFTLGPGLHPHSGALSCPSLPLGKKGVSGKDVEGMRASSFLKKLPRKTARHKLVTL